MHVAIAHLEEKATWGVLGLGEGGAGNKGTDEVVGVSFVVVERFEVLNKECLEKTQSRG